MDMAVQDSFLTINGIFKVIHETDFLKEQILFQVFHLILYFNNVIAFTYLIPEDLGKFAKHFTDFIFPVLYCQPMDGIQGVVDEVRVNLGLKRPDFRILLHFTDLLNLVHLVINLSHHLIKLAGYDGYLILAFHFHVGGHFPGPYLLHGIYHLLNRCGQPAGQDPYKETAQHHQAHGYHPYYLLEIPYFL